MRRNVICLAALGGHCVYDVETTSFVAPRGEREALTTDASNWSTREAACQWIARQEAKR